MDGKTWSIIVLLLMPVLINSSRQDRRDYKEILDRKERRSLHYQPKQRHNMQLENEAAVKRPTTMKINRDVRKKPSGHLTPLEDDDLDNDEVVSVAIHPPPAHPKTEMFWKNNPKAKVSSMSYPINQLPNLIKNIFAELGRELITKHVSDDFIFGQYIGSGMQNLPAEKKLQMQHEVLNLLEKYQSKNELESTKLPEQKLPSSQNPLSVVTSTSVVPDRKITQINDSDDSWPDFSNIATLVG